MTVDDPRVSTVGRGREQRRTIPESARLRASIRRAFNERELLLNLVLRDLRARYRRTVLGWGWSLLYPAAMTIVYSIVFVFFLKVKPQPGQPSGMTSYTIYLLAGILPWNAVTGGIQQGMGALVGGAPLMTKVRFAREHLVIATVLSLVVTLLIELGIVTVLTLIMGYNTLPYLPVAIVLVMLLAMFAVGLALPLAALNIRYRDLQHLMGVVLTMWFYLTPIIYPVQFIPERAHLLGREIPLRSILEANPMARFTMAFRNCFFDVQMPGWNTMLGLTATAVVTLVGGYVFFARRAPWFAEEI
jgi:ABC-type polysaccharide/polyol phosphate export permease